MLAVGHHDVHLRRSGAERPDDHRAILGMRTEVRMRVRVLAGDQLVGITHGHSYSESRSRTIPATGIATQSGRLLSSYRSSYTAFSSSKTASSWSVACWPGGRREESTARWYPVRKRSRARSPKPWGPSPPRRIRAPAVTYENERSMPA